MKFSVFPFPGHSLCGIFLQIRHISQIIHDYPPCFCAELHAQASQILRKSFHRRISGNRAAAGSFLFHENLLPNSFQTAEHRLVHPNIAKFGKVWIHTMMDICRHPIRSGVLNVLAIKFPFFLAVADIQA